MSLCPCGPDASNTQKPLLLIIQGQYGDHQSPPAFLLHHLLSSGSENGAKDTM